MGYLSGSISLSLAAHGHDRTAPGAATALFRWVQPVHRFTPCNGKGLPIMSSRNVAVGAKLG
jgi:hypothetical protein